jgi:hypothetical protein
MEKIPQELSSVDWSFFPAPKKYLIDVVIFPACYIFSGIPDEKPQLRCLSR